MQYRYAMSKVEKTLAGMRSNPRDWKIEQLESLAKRYGIEVRKTGGSHFVFLHPDSDIAVTVPFNRPFQPAHQAGLYHPVPGADR